MATTENTKKKLALVYGSLPTVEEIDQFRLVTEEYDVSVISTESICGYLTQTSFFQDLKCIALPDHEDNHTYLPGLEHVLSQFDIVMIKERMGLYAFQAVKAKWKHRFRLAVWVDNATPFPGEDIDQMRTIREEVSKAADAFIVQTDVLKNTLILEGVEEARIIKFNPWVESRVKRGARNRANALERLGLGDNDFVIAHFGQIEWEEGLFDLVHGLKLLQKTDKTLAERTRLVFCGIGSFSAELRDRLVSLGLDRQAVYVAPSRDAFDTVYTAADCIYNANNPARDRVEGEPYRVVAAMVNRIPILSARTPVVEEIIGKHRIDFCPNSAASIANAIKKLIGANSLKNNIVNKYAATVKSHYSRTKVMGQMEIALNRIFRTAATIDANALDHQVLEVEALVQSKQYLSAIDVIETIFKLKDLPTHHHANLLRLIGDCFTKLGDGESGKRAYQQSLELDPYSAKSFIGMGTVCLTSSQFDPAVIHFQKAISLAPDDEMANLGLGLAFQGLEENEEAIKWVEKSLESDPTNTAALFTIVQLANSLDKYDSAEVALMRYLTVHPYDHNMLYTLAGIQRKTGKIEEAIQNIRPILEADPSDQKATALLKEIERSKASQAETSNG